MKTIPHGRSARRLVEFFQNFSWKQGQNGSHTTHWPRCRRGEGGEEEGEEKRALQKDPNHPLKRIGGSVLCRPEAPRVITGITLHGEERSASFSHVDSQTDLFGLHFSADSVLLLMSIPGIPQDQRVIDSASSPSYIPKPMLREKWRTYLDRGARCGVATPHDGGGAAASEKKVAFHRRSAPETSPTSLSSRDELDKS
jgi:hypothetical protein